MATTRAKRKVRENSSPATPRKKPTQEQSTMQESNGGSVKDRMYYRDLFMETDYLREIYSRQFMVNKGCMGWAGNVSFESIDEDHTIIRSLLRPWVVDFAASETDHEKSLLAEQKEHIIRSLKGSCVQEDWDVLKARLPQLVGKRMMEVFLEALMLKDIHTRFFENPGHELGKYHQERRTALLGDIVDGLIASKPICWLLKSLTEEEERERRNYLLAIYQKVAEISTHHAAARGCFDFHRLEGLEQTFQEASDMLRAHVYHFLPKGDTKLDGRRVLLVVHPAILRTYVNEAPCPEFICTKAHVIVEDPPKQEDTEVDNQGE
ncbi:hypothetical protein PHISCL_07385 [Aspergillus sclerotialis]|uniref:Uncharacterized protein n=1 Tax=Aspergillus sclerotialis TaxID=2070753 RepID=A0A3A2ZBI8_9EURO|nr:hypothetical protein PHISCL_07385 [Aspergillus sclerotialis]